MKIEGMIAKDGKFWIVSIPGLDLMTQALTKKEAYVMAASVVEDVVGKDGFKCSVEPVQGNMFTLFANDPTELVALMLRRQRANSGYSLMKVSERLGSKSPNTFGAYEQGKRQPSIEKLGELLGALDLDFTVSIRPQKKSAVA